MENIKAEVLELWPELEWIEDAELQNKNSQGMGEGPGEKCAYGSRRPKRIPFTLLVRTRSEGLFYGTTRDPWCI